MQCGEGWKLTVNSPTERPDTSSTQATLAHTQCPPLRQLATLETDLVEQVHKLQKRKCISSTTLTLKEMLNLIEEEVVNRTLDFSGGDDDDVQDNNNNEESDSDDEAEDTEKQITKPSETLDLCAHMEQLCLKYSMSNITVLGLQTQLHKLQG